MFQFLATALPSIILVYIFYTFDFFPEPKRLVIYTFLFGIFITIPAGYINVFFMDYIDKNFIYGSDSYNFFDNLIPGATVEEILKFLVLFFFCRKLKDFDEPMDGLVYGVAASLGFAAYENIEYVMYALNEPSFEIATIRAYTAVPLHALCGIMMGFLITQSIFEKENNYLNLVLALFIPVGIHGLYNFSLSSSTVSSYFSYIIIIAFIVRAYFLFKNLKIRQSRSIIFNKKYYSISLNNFVNASTTVLIIYLGLNYLVHIVL